MDNARFSEILQSSGGCIITANENLWRTLHILWFEDGLANKLLGIFLTSQLQRIPKDKR